MKSLLVEILQRKGESIIFDQDEFPRAGVTAESLAKLRPAFKKDGSVTAANASGINDGEAAVVVMSKAKAIELGIQPMALISANASAGVDPSIMGTGAGHSGEESISEGGCFASRYRFN
ncbi:3-ketoacyl-CoA thiolase [Lysinibacillus sphaericus]